MESNQGTGFTIIVPTYHEAANIPDLAKRIASVDYGRAFEVLLIDDNSNDGITEVVAALTKQYPWLKLIVRHGNRDLSRSVINGFENASYPTLITLDADLSHPPEEIPKMLSILEQPGVDIVIGSRYVKGGSVDQKWPFIRRLSSKTAALIARALLFTHAKDPLSGFLALKKQTFLSGDPLEPIGWKVGLELMVKCQCKNIREIPIHFSQRRYGDSKLNFKISFDYLHHVIKLMQYRLDKFINFRFRSIK